MILSEDLLLLLTDDGSGRTMESGERLAFVLAGGVLTDLLLAGRVAVAAPGESVRAGRLVVRDATPVGDPVLDEGLRRLASTTPKKPQSALGPLRSGLLDELRARLVARGILRVEQGKVLGIFPRTSWPAEDSSHEAGLRQRLRDVLVDGRHPDPREAALIALLHSVNQVPVVMGDVGVSVRDLRARSSAIAHQHIGAEAVRRAITAYENNSVADGFGVFVTGVS
ncbi:MULTISPECIES: GPP34 family phosphoprotein [unclassified Actinotalea]|uniref:GOLPH3/VPS74 family protein n=1 Tax=unclassified Actinotalea TaxID=2638618 RepID=UPI0015F5C11F|nr:MULTISPECIES: GPP34 family phosphoprotein [unclassified Actinotalea]